MDAQVQFGHCPGHQQVTTVTAFRFVGQTGQWNAVRLAAGGAGELDGL
jgi:hypothetical protein